MYSSCLLFHKSIVHILDIVNTIRVGNNANFNISIMVPMIWNGWGCVGNHLLNELTDPKIVRRFISTKSFSISLCRFRFYCDRFFFV